MEETSSILIPDTTSDTPAANAEQLEVTQHNYGENRHENHINTKPMDAESQLNRVFEEYSGRIESFVLMLETLREGIVIINKAGEVCFVNEAGNTLLPATRPYLNYRELSTEESMPLSLSPELDVYIRINSFFWNGEPCNIFILEKKEVIKKEEVIADVITATNQPVISQPFAGLMAYMQQIADHEIKGKTAEALACAEMAGKTVLQSEKLLGDIKTYIGLANYQPVISQVSMQKLVGDVLKAMGPEIEEAGVEVSVSDLPEAKADKELVLKLMRHLVYNALKFRNKTRKAIIDIGHDKSDGQYIFCVRDNGIGISKKYHEQVFNLFSMVNDTNEYEGNGMGLAICKKIIELHEGKIWVESLPGHGSNFYFKLNVK